MIAFAYREFCRVDRLKIVLDRGRSAHVRGRTRFPVSIRCLRSHGMSLARAIIAEGRPSVVCIRIARRLRFACVRKRRCCHRRRSKDSLLNGTQSTKAETVGVAVFRTRALLHERCHDWWRCVLLAVSLPPERDQQPDQDEQEDESRGNGQCDEDDEAKCKIVCKDNQCQTQQQGGFATVRTHVEYGRKSHGWNKRDRLHQLHHYRCARRS